MDEFILSSALIGGYLGCFQNTITDTTAVIIILEQKMFHLHGKYL